MALRNFASASAPFNPDPMPSRRTSISPCRPVTPESLHLSLPASLHLPPDSLRLSSILAWILVLTSSTQIDSALAQGSPSWQQRVEYEMDVQLNVQEHRLDGHQVLHYHNNSPDTLHRVFYHLYFNAFHPHSAMAERNRHLPDPDSRIVPRIFQLGPDEIGYHRIERLMQDGEDVDFRIDDTVMDVRLAHPIPPRGIARFEMEFTSQIPLQTRRSGRDNREGIDYSMTQWYPKIANYDSRGWHADPYVGREFYAPFGTFDVRITLPAEFVVGATGVLQNPDAVGHGYGSTAAGPATNSERLTWHFRATDVHDFAWAADPDYIHDVIHRGGIEHHLLYQPDVAENWAALRESLPLMVDFFSERYGPYPYPQVSVVQGGDGGMEYPMITLITGRRSPSSLLGVTVHEIAHMWYYGIIGSNESDYAWLDEGFVSFVASEFDAHLAGRPDATHTSAHLAVLLRHDLDIFEPLNTPSDWFRTNTAYSTAAYQGGEMVVDMLGYVISDSLRDRFLLEYFDRFKFRHPMPYDVEKVAEDVSGLQLDWFFEQLTNTTWQLDYAMGGATHRRNAEGWEADILIERRGDIAMPVDLLITYEDGRQQWITIPVVDMHGHKPVPDSWIVADAWSWTSPRYILTLNDPARVHRVEVDPALRTPDVNRLNNRSDFPVRFDFFDPPEPTWTQYSVGWRPALHYASNFGVGGGIQFRGTYAFGRYRTKALLGVWPEVILSDGDEPNPHRPIPPGFQSSTSWFDGVDFNLQFGDRVRRFGAYGVVSLRTEKYLGVLQNELAFTTPLRGSDLLTDKEHRLTLQFRHQVRTSRRALVTEPAHGFVSDDLLSARASFTYTDVLTRFDLHSELGGTVGDGFLDISANRIYMDAARAADLGAFIGGARIRIGTGASNLAQQKRYRLGAPPFEERWANGAYRSIGAVFTEPLADAHWVAFAGPGPVAYARDAGGSPARIVTDAPIGDHVLAASAVLVKAFSGRQDWVAPLQTEFFFGAGQVWSGGGFFDEISLSDLLFDAGIGLRYDVADLPALQRWTAQSDILSSLKLTAKFPFWASDARRSGSSHGLDFRWLIGITTDNAPWY